MDGCARALYSAQGDMVCMDLEAFSTGAPAPAAGGPAPAPGANCCPNGGIFFNNKCYGQQARTWVDKTAQCAASRAGGLDKNTLYAEVGEVQQGIYNVEVRNALTRCISNDKVIVPSALGRARMVVSETVQPSAPAACRR